MEIAAGWWPDPTGRHESRYWEGASWSDSVADGGVQATDQPSWPAPPAAAGLGLRSGYLRYFRIRRDPWPVVDFRGEQVGWVARSANPFGPRTADVWDMGNNVWLRVKQGMRGTAVLVGGAQVGLVGWHGVGAMSTVDISLQYGGRHRARMRAKGGELLDGSARVTDPGGTPLLSVATGWDRDAQGPTVTVQRLVGTPDDYEYLVQALAPALILELDNRAGFDADDTGLRRTTGVWPGL